MASPATGSSKVPVPDMGLSASETRVLLLALVLSVDGKVDFKKLAERAGYGSVGSARTTYNAARRKLFKLHGDDAAGNTDDAPPPVKKARKSTGGRKRKQTVADTSADDTPADDTAAETIADEEAGRDIAIEGESDE